MAEQFLTLMADLDDDSQALMVGWYEDLQEAGFTGVQTPGLPYHISLATFPLDKEEEAIEVCKKAAAEFMTIPVNVSHMGLFPGGKVLFAAPDINDRLSALNKACEKYPGEFAWTPHITVLIDEPDTICAALPTLIKSFRPFAGRITKLHLCAFWPTREILSIELKKEKMKTLFETEHLTVRCFSPEDAKRLYEYHLDEKVKHWMPNESYADIAEAGDAIGFFSDCVNKEELPYVLAVESKLTGELIGDTGINEVDGAPGEVEIGFVISDDYSGRGYATELVKAMMAYVFEKFDIKVLYGRVMHGNGASVRVLEKNGFSFAKEEFDAEDDPYGKGMLVYTFEQH